MGLVYHDDENSVGGVSNKVGLRLRLDKMNPNGPYKKHVTNWYYLKFIYANGTVNEKRQAQKELGICERKMAFWYRHPAFCVIQAGKDTQSIQQQWNSKEQPNAVKR